MRSKGVRVIVLAISTSLCVINLLSSSQSVSHIFAIIGLSIRSAAPSVKKSYTVPELLVKGSPSVIWPMVVVVCEAPDRQSTTYGDEKDPEAYLLGSWARQTEQLTTMLTTLFYFSKSAVWRIIVLTDSVATFHKVVNLTSEFPENRLLLQHRLLWLPQDQPQLQQQWRPCVWAKQFLAEALPDEDAVVYVDTDVVFLGPAEELWWLLHSLGPHQALALAPEPQYQRDQPRRPFAGHVGLNTGMMAVNLTRLRQLEGGGLGSDILRAGIMTPPPRHDQDALNHYLSLRPHLLLEVTSRWNFLPSACFSEAPECPDCLSAGITVLHGADATFHRNIDRKFMVMYKSLLRLQLELNPRVLLAWISALLAVIDSRHHDFACTNFTHLNHALTLGLQDAAVTKTAHLTQ